MIDPAFWSMILIFRNDPVDQDCQFDCRMNDPAIGIDLADFWPLDVI